MATTNLGRVRFNMRGDYNPAADPLYSLLDLVSDGGGSFVYINDTPSNEPTSSTSHWQQIASIGGQDLVDAAVAARDAAQGYKDAAAASAAQLQAGIGSPAGKFANLAAVNAANPSHDRTYLTEDDWKIAMWDEIAQAFVAGGVYQATGIAQNSILETQIGLNSIEPFRHYKTGQFPLTLKTTPKNMFNKDTVTDGYYVVWSTGALAENAAYAASDYIPVYPGQVLYANLTAQLAFYNQSKVYVSGIDNPTTFTVPADSYYLRICFGNANLSIIQVEEGAAQTAYESHYSVLTHNAALYFSDSFFAEVVSKNMYDPSIGTDGYYVSWSTGTLSANAAYTVSDFIPVLPSTDYARNILNQLAFYTKNKVYISGINQPGATESFTTPATAAYVRVCILITQKTLYQLELGAEVTEYLPYNAKLVTRNQLYSDAKPNKTPHGIMSQIVLSGTEKKIKLIGDSITHGYGGTGFAQDGELIMTWYASTFNVNTDGHCWANSLKSYLEEKHNCTVTNYGCTGANSGMIVDGLSQLIDGDEDIIICMIGTNDRNNNTQQVFYNNLITIYDYCTELGIEIIFMSSIPASVANETNAGIDYHMEDVDEVIMKAASDLNMEYISVYKLFSAYCLQFGVTIDSLLADGLHPSDAGYDVMFALICNALGFGIKRPDATW